MSEEFKVEIVNPEKSFLVKEDVSEVVDVCHATGIANKVVKLKPMGVVKG